MTQSAAQNWDRHWNRMLLETRQKPIPAPTGSLKRFLQRAGGIELAFQVVLRELRHTYGKRILEAGCGSGEISLRLARRGNQVFMLDVSHSALQLAKDAARDIDKAPFFIQGSIFNLPFREEAFDFIFNIGVLDHFGPTRRKEAVRELLRGARASANVLILLNDAHSWVHPPAMRHALKKGTWPFGFKDSLHSLEIPEEGFIRATIIKKYCRGFVSQFEFLRYYFPQKQWCQRLFFRLYFLLTWPFSLLNYFPGQYLVTVLQKQNLRP